MKRIGIRELHLKAGEWVRSAALCEGVVITDRGTSGGVSAAGARGDLSTPFGQRRTLSGFDALPPMSGDSGVYVSEDRDRG